MSAKQILGHIALSEPVGLMKMLAALVLFLFHRLADSANYIVRPRKFISAVATGIYFTRTRRDTWYAHS